MRTRETIEARKIAAARKMRSLKDTGYGKGNITLVELPIIDPQVAIITDGQPSRVYMYEFVVTADLAIRVLDAESVKHIGSANFWESGRQTHSVFPIVYDGAGMFWWFKASAVPNVAATIRDDVLSHVDQVLQGGWRDEDDALQAANDTVAAFNGRYAVLPDNRIMQGSSSPQFILHDDGYQMSLRLGDLHFETVLERLSGATTSLQGRPLVKFDLFEDVAAEEFMSLIATRCPTRKINGSAFLDKRDGGWIADFTGNRDRWADARSFSEFASHLFGVLGAVRPFGDNALNAALEKAQYHTKIWLHDHEAAAERIAKFLDLRDLCLKSDPQADQVLANHMKWSLPVLPLELLEIRARHLQQLLAEPEVAPVP